MKTKKNCKEKPIKKLRCAGLMANVSGYMKKKAKVHALKPCIFFLRCGIMVLGLVPKNLFFSNLF